MCAKALVFLALATIVRGNDIIVGLKTDGKKFFDENRQANPALWRQMDNVTIKAPENEVIRRIVITDLRPEKDGDVKIVEGGEGQKNVTIELKSPTVLRGYEFHIEAYSFPEEQIPFTNEQQSTTENLKDYTKSTFANYPATNLDSTSKTTDLSTDKINPALLTTDEEIKDGERQGRNAKEEINITTKGTPEFTSTTLKSDVSTAPTTENTGSTTDNHNDKNTDATIKFIRPSATTSIPLNTKFNMNPASPAVSGRDILSHNDETRHVRDIEEEISDESTEINPTKDKLESSTENDKETTTTELTSSTPVEAKFEGSNKDFSNRKYTSIITTKVEHPPAEVKDNEKPRNVRGANKDQKLDENVSTTTEFTEISTSSISDGTSTLPNDDCATTEDANDQIPVNVGKDINESKPDAIPMYINNRQWHQRFNNPTLQTDHKFPDLKLNPAVFINDQSTLTPDIADTERLGDNYRPSPDHMENRNPEKQRYFT